MKADLRFAELTGQLQDAEDEWAAISMRLILESTDPTKWWHVWQDTKAEAALAHVAVTREAVKDYAKAHAK